MPSEFPMNEPQNIWQNQPTEAFKMSADQLRYKAQRHQRKDRFEALRTIIAGLIICVFFAWEFVRVHEMVARLGLSLLSLWSIRLGCGVLSLSGVYVAHQAYKWIWPGRLAPDATLHTTIQFYRSGLEKRRDYVRDIWRRGGLTFWFLGMAMGIAPILIKAIVATPRLLLNLAPLFVLLVIWCAIFFPLRKRRQQKLQQEIEALRAFEREYQS